MNSIKAALGRLAQFWRHAGGFASAADVRALTAQLRALDRRRGEIDGLGHRLDAMARESARMKAALADIRGALDKRATSRHLGEVRDQLRQWHQQSLDAAAADQRERRRQRGDVKAIAGQVDAVVRRLHVDPAALDLPYRLTVQRFRGLSQGAEDGITLAIFKEIGVASRRFVDIGCADHGWNTGFFVEELGWTGVMIDRNGESIAATRRRFSPARVHTVTAVVTRENIDDLLRQHDATDVDLLSIDIDINDFWLWEALEAARPRVVIVEYNAAFGAERAVVVPYDANREWDDAARQHGYHGASLRALQRLGRRKGYRLVAVEPDGTNAFFVRDDVAGTLAAVDAADAFRAQAKYRDRPDRQPGAVFAAIEAAALPLETIPGD